FTENKRTFQELKEKKLPVIFYPSLTAILILLRASTLIVDNYWWYRNMKYYLLYRSYKVQMWHALGIKAIGTDMLKVLSWPKRLFKKCIYILGGLYVNYDLLLHTSEFYIKNYFEGAIEFKKALVCGYPRNDCFFQEINDLILLETDIRAIEKTKEAKKNGYKVILYGPTFSGSGRDPIMDRALNIERLQEFVKKYKILFVFKFHHNPRHKYEIKESENIIVYNNFKDMYPLLPLVDLLISDYSSIHMDCLLIDKPCIFFPYDYEDYIRRNGELKFSYDWIAPGPKCNTQEELEEEIIKYLIEKKDDYKEKRKDLLEVVFKYKDGKSSERMWNIIKEERMTP
ncbi:MAG TPA: CDP-glycerol glycerophosphotransferase family protein, partial [Candidatus Eremiobacteraeota bacterium]|nr:CDP-glycerol glycerophosphotransferase family protein [Candidatus Eremiobacteraeota bacterium]